MNFSCPNCSQTMTCPESAAGKKATCPKCGQKILIPTPPQAVSFPTNKTTLGKLEESISAAPIPIATVAAPPPAPPFATAEESTDSGKKPEFNACPFCRGDVPRNAIKCRHCGETLDAGARASEEARREASLLAESTDVFGVIGFIVSLFSVLSLFLVCCYGVGVLVAVPLGVVGGGCSLMGRGNLRIAGLVLNGISIFIGIVAGAIWLVIMIAAASQPRQFN